MIVVGAGILGLSVAEAASRRGLPVDVIESPRHPPASLAAAAQLGLKGQSLCRSGAFALKMQGARGLPAWLASWDPDAWSTYFKVGLGRDRVLSQAECAEQLRRVTRHENHGQEHFVGPPLVYLADCDRDPSSGAAALCYLQESAVDARILLSRLRSVLQSRGVGFWQCDVACAAELEEFLVARAAGDTEGLSQRPWVLAAGAWSLEVLREWDSESPVHLVPASVRYSLGASVVGSLDDFSPASPVALPLDFNRFVTEGLIDRSRRQIAALTHHDAGVVLTSLSVPAVSAPCGQALTADTLPGQVFAKPWAAMRDLLARHGLRSPDTPLLWHGLRARFSSRDLLVEELPCPPVLARAVARCVPDCGHDLPRVMVFAGANRSGFAYGPALAHQIVSRLSGSVLR